MANKRRQSNESITSSINAVDQKPYAEFVFDASGTLTIPSNVETAFTYTSSPRSRGTPITFSGSDIILPEVGTYRLVFQGRWSTDVWTKYYVVKSSDNSILAESPVGGNGRIDSVEMIFTVTAVGTAIKLTTYMSGGNTIIQGSLTGSPRGANPNNRILMVLVQKI